MTQTSPAESFVQASPPLSDHALGPKLGSNLDPTETGSAADFINDLDTALHLVKRFSNRSKTIIYKDGSRFKPEPKGSPVHLESLHDRLVKIFCQTLNLAGKDNALNTIDSLAAASKSAAHSYNNGHTLTHIWPGKVGGPTKDKLALVVTVYDSVPSVARRWYKT